MQSPARLLLFMGEKIGGMSRQFDQVEQHDADLKRRAAPSGPALPDLGERMGEPEGVLRLVEAQLVAPAAALAMPHRDVQAARIQAQVAQAQLDTARAQLSDSNAQVDADVRDALLDIASSQKLVEVARSSVELANEALSEAQLRYANGVSDNLGVSQAQQSVAQANDQYVTSLYRHNVAKLSLARALGAGENYKNYLGGK